MYNIHSAHFYTYSYNIAHLWLFEKNKCITYFYGEETD